MIMMIDLKTLQVYKTSKITISCLTSMTNTHVCCHNRQLPQIVCVNHIIMIIETNSLQIKVLTIH